MKTAYINILRNFTLHDQFSFNSSPKLSLSFHASATLALRPRMCNKAKHTIITAFYSCWVSNFAFALSFYVTLGRIIFQLTKEINNKKLKYIQVKLLALMLEWQKLVKSTCRGSINIQKPEAETELRTLPTVI